MSVVSPEAARFTYADLLSGQLTPLVDLEWAGVTLRLSVEDEIAPVGPGGDDVAYWAGLDWGGSLERTLGLFSDQPDSATVDVSLYTYPRLDVPTLIAAGYPLGGARAKFRWWLRGTDRVMTVVDGRLRDPSWDVSPLPVVGTIEEAPFLDEALYPPTTHRITTETWPNHDPAVTGEYYPTVFGAPGYTGGHVHSTPGLIVSTTARYLLVAGHHVDADGSAIRIVNTSTGTEAYVTVFNYVDTLGQPVALVDLTASGIYAAGDSYWCRWHDAAGDAQYGIVAGGSALKTAQDVLLWWMRRSRVRWDVGRIAALASMLMSYQIDTYAMAEPDKRITPYHWVQDHLLPILPVSTQFGPRGLYFVHWNYFADSSAAVLDIVEGTNADRIEAVETTGLDDVYASIEVAYLFDPDKGEYNGRIVLSGNPETIEDDDDATPDLYLRRAYQQYGTTRSITLKTEVVEDSATAGRITQWLARRYGAQSYRMKYIVQAPRIASHYPGAVVRVTDSGRGFSARLALIESIVYESSDRIETTLVMPAFDAGNAA